MESGEYYCKDCVLYFDSSQSLEVHLQYHKENLLNMWMGSNEIKREAGTENDSDVMHMNRSSSVSTSTSSTNMSSEIYVKQEVKENRDMQPSPSYIGPSPISPMDYDFKLEPNSSFKSEPDVNHQSNLVSPGPSSGSGLINYPQSSTGGYYQDFSQSPVQQSSFNYQSGFLINGTYDDQFFNRGNINSRYHPYGRSPLPTPSPGASMTDIKEERLTPGTPEILDLDSQKVLNGNANQQSQHAPLPPMWRPHEQFPSPGNSSSGLCNSSGLIGSPNMRPSSTGLDPPAGLVATPSGMGASPAGLGSSPFGIGPSSSGLGPSPTGLGGSLSVLGPSPTSLRHSTGLGPSSGAASSTGVGPPVSSLGSSVSGSLSSNLGISHGLGPSQISMLPPLQQPSYGNQPMHQNHQGISVSSNSPGYQTSNMMPSFYSQGISVNSGINNNSPVQFASTPTPSPSPRDGPPTEYPSNVKRAKSFKCDDCNKWFTSHGHLKRHYNTTLHKNMTKLNTSSGSNQSTAPDVTRPPILSPSSKSIGETPSTSSHDEESNLSTNDSLEPTTSNTFQPVGSAFQPPTPAVTNYSSQNAPYPGSAIALGHINPSHSSHPAYTQPHSFPPEQPLTAQTMYHGQFSTNPSYPSQPPVTGNSHYFLANNYIYHTQQGGSHGPGFHSMNEYPGPSPVDSLNSYRLDNDKISHQYIVSTESTPRISPEPSGDTGSEASMDSSESSSTGPVEHYKCNDCNKTFNRMCYLTQHRSTYHEGEKPFKCGTCGKRFTDEVTFTDHQGKHAGEKPYKCEVCPKQFNHKTDLRRHMCLHTGEKPFSCEQCGKGFIRKDHMLKHFQTHRKKALAAAQNNPATSHPSMSQNPSGYTSHPGLPPPHGSLPHQTHGPHGHPGHPHVVAPPVY